MPRHAKSTKHRRDTAMVEGLRKHRRVLSALVAVSMGSVDELIARFEAHLDAMDAATRLETRWRAALRREAQLEEGVKELMRRLTPLLQGVFGRAGPRVRDFGIRPYVRRKPSVATMKAAVEKRRATRAARQTRGRRQKSKIKGSVG